MRHSCHRARALLPLAGVTLCLFAACARQGLPPGGPRDLRPPTVVATVPDSGTVRVPLGAALEIEFSEPMDRASVIDWVLLSPPRDFASRSWDGSRFRLAGGEDFRAQSTYTVIVGTGCRDRRERNPMAAPHTFVFATGDSIDQGRIEGRLSPKGQSAHGTMIWALDVALAGARPDTVLPDYIAQAGGDSTFVFLGLRLGRRYVVAAHFDANRDREFDAQTEFLAFYPDTLELSAAHPVRREIDIDYRDPRAPGSIAGAVVDSTRAAQVTAGTDGLAVGATAAAADRIVAAAAAAAESRATASRPLAAGDSLRSVAARTDTPPGFLVRAWPLIELDGRPAIDSTAVHAATTDSLLHYELRNLDPGLWRLEAALDRDRDGRYDAGEPRSAPLDSVRVVPLETTAADDLVVGEE